MKGYLASQAGYSLALSVLKSQRGFYIGTSQDFIPVSRESVEYFKTQAEAQAALENNSFTQRLSS
jgi:hypothetical protein